MPRKNNHKSSAIASAAAVDISPQLVGLTCLALFEVAGVLLPVVDSRSDFCGHGYGSSSIACPYHTHRYYLQDQLSLHEHECMLYQFSALYDVQHVHIGHTLYTLAYKYIVAIVTYQCILLCIWQSLTISKCI